MQHRIEVQERSHKESQAKQIPVCDGMRYNSQEEQKLYEAMLDMEGKLDSGEYLELAVTSFSYKKTTRVAQW